jgi:hypothetical protein
MQWSFLQGAPKEYTPFESRIRSRNLAVSRETSNPETLMAGLSAETREEDETTVDKQIRVKTNNNSADVRNPRSVMDAMMLLTGLSQLGFFVG